MTVVLNEWKENLGEVEENPSQESMHEACALRTRKGRGKKMNYSLSDMKLDPLPSDVSQERGVKMWPSAHSPLLSNEDKTGMLHCSLPGCKPLPQLIGNY